MVDESGYTTIEIELPADEAEAVLLVLREKLNFTDVGHELRMMRRDYDDSQVIWYRRPERRR